VKVRKIVIELCNKRENKIQVYTCSSFILTNHYHITN